MDCSVQNEAKSVDCESYRESPLADSKGWAEYFSALYLWYSWRSINSFSWQSDIIQLRLGIFGSWSSYWWLFFRKIFCRYSQNNFVRYYFHLSQNMALNKFWTIMVNEFQVFNWTLNINCFYSQILFHQPEVSINNRSVQGLAGCQTGQPCTKICLIRFPCL